MNWLNYHHLYYFKIVVEQGSIAKASEVLRIGQPSISAQIKLLEGQLKTHLFVRKNKKLFLTKTGEIVYDYAKEIFKLGSELLNTANDQFHGKLKIQIGIQDCVPKNLVASLTSYIYKHFKAEISIHNGSLEDITLKVLRDEYDVGLLNYPPLIKDKGILYSKRILQSKVVLAGAKNFLHLKNKHWNQFDNQPFILPSLHSSLRPKFEHYFQKHKVNYDVIGEADDTIVQKNMAIGGNGIITIMKEAIDHYVKTKQLFVLKEIDEIQDEIWLVCGKRKIQNPIEQKLVDDFHF